MKPEHKDITLRPRHVLCLLGANIQWKKHKLYKTHKHLIDMYLQLQDYYTKYPNADIHVYNQYDSLCDYCSDHKNSKCFKRNSCKKHITTHDLYIQLDNIIFTYSRIVEPNVYKASYLFPQLIQFSYNKKYLSKVCYYCSRKAMCSLWNTSKNS